MHCRYLMFSKKAITGDFVVCAFVFGLMACGNEIDTNSSQQEQEKTSTFSSGMAEVFGAAPQKPGDPQAIISLFSELTLEVPFPKKPTEIDQYGRAFFPSVTAIRAGQEILFRNSEDELHNVNVKDQNGDTIFNVGMPILGGTFQYTFERAGSYSVACNVHQEMAATIVVSDGVYTVLADRDGRFVIHDVPYGRYNFEIRRGNERSSFPIDVQNASTEMVFDEE